MRIFPRGVYFLHCALCSESDSLPLSRGRWVSEVPVQGVRAQLGQLGGVQPRPVVGHVAIVHLAGGEAGRGWQRGFSPAPHELSGAMGTPLHTYTHMS